jgi:hypothetical protein
MIEPAIKNLPNSINISRRAASRVTEKEQVLGTG